MDAEIQAGIDYLKKIWTDAYPDRDGFIIPPEDVAWNEEAGEVTFTLPHSEQQHIFNRDDFLRFVQDCKTAKVDDSERIIRTASRTIMVVSPENVKAEYISFHEEESLSLKFNDTISFSFQPVSAVVGVVVLRRDWYQHDFSPDLYFSVELLYAAGTQKLPDNEELNLLDSFLFELAATADIVFSKGSLRADTSDPFEKLKNEKYVPKLKPIEPFNEGMRLFNAAVQVNDSELRLLSLFKVLEYFGPIVWALDGNEAIRKKLDSPSSLNPDANYLQSIFELTRSLDKRRNDSEMIKMVLEKCVDMIELSKKLPQSRFKELKYDDKKSDIESQTRLVGEALVSTRNQFAHAKSDYKPTGSEMKENELPEFNSFVEAAAVQTIRWYNRLPAHLKLKL
jgi:hypothetical protein